ncbi:IclR family transcriptional regulator [Devosia sp.]|uniref:IclR family transcriptional regulator n=1 Tax=Devosia sp. TaxID=1871048 RepID=UPI0035AFCF2D
MASSSNASRAAAMLLLLGKSGAAGAPLKELAEELEDAKPAVLRCLNSLIEFGFAEQVSRGRYRLGPTIFSLARSESAVQVEVARWHSVLDEVVETFGQSVALVRRAGMEVVIVDKLVGTSPVQALVTQIGGRLPMGIGAGSVAILSSLDHPDWAEIVQRNSEKYPKWNFDAEMVAKHVEQAVVRGFSFDSGLLIPECAGLAVPIRERGQYESDLALTLSVPRAFFEANQPTQVASRLKSIIDARQSGATG